MIRKISLYLKRGMVIIAACGFFGLLYPQLSLIEETFKMAGEEIKEDDWYLKLLSAEPGEIKIKSRLLELINTYFEKDRENGR